MDAKELVEKVKKNENNMTVELFEEVLEWCNKNNAKMDLSDENHNFLYKKVSEYLIGHKIGNWSQEDAKTMIYCYANDFARQRGISDKLTIDITYDDYIQETKWKKTRAICTYDEKEKKSKVCYSQSVINSLTSNSIGNFLRGLRDIVHEVVHAEQNYAMHKESSEYTGNNFRSTLEYILRIYVPEYYNDNYSRLFRENQAESVALYNASKMIAGYNPKLYIKCADTIGEMLQVYNDRAYLHNNKSILGGTEENTEELLGFFADQCIKKRPETLKEYPVLTKAYNSDGSKKTVIQLIEERNSSAESTENVEGLDELYFAMMSYRRTAEKTRLF